eukprot:341561-Amphidinium_carterae.1
MDLGSGCEAAQYVKSVKVTCSRKDNHKYSSPHCDNILLPLLLSLQFTGCFLPLYASNHRRSE